MRVYRFLMPDMGNDGRNYQNARLTFQAHIGRLAGGFTRYYAAYGYWTDEAGETYSERSHPIDVAVEDGKGEATRRRLVQLFYECFPDQLTCYSAEVGEALIDKRPETNRWGGPLEHGSDPLA